MYMSLLMSINKIITSQMRKPADYTTFTFLALKWSV